MALKRKKIVKSKDVEYPKDFAPISHVKPKNKVARTMNELIHGSKTYMPRTSELAKEQESITKEVVKLRKAQSKFKTLTRKSK